MARKARSDAGKVRIGIAGMGFMVRAAAASTFGCAWAFARFPEHPLAQIPSGTEHQALAPLPIEALRVDDHTIEALSEVNLDRIGQLYELPRRDLAARFGSSLLLRLDQATGKAIETIDPVRPRGYVQVQREFDGPATQIEAIEITARNLLDELCIALLRRERGVLKFTLELARIDAARVWTTIILSRASRSAKHLWSLLRPRIESMNMGFGVEAVILTAVRTTRIPHVQRTHLESDANASDSAIDELLDTIMARVGHDRVTRAQLTESHLPELAFRHRSVMDCAAVDLDTTVPSSGWGGATVRPTRLLAQPIRVEVETNDDRPSAWVWQGIRQRIIESVGPERVWLPWWSGSSSPMLGREYYAAQDQSGRWLWLYRFNKTGGWGAWGGWFLHGEWA